MQPHILRCSERCGGGGDSFEMIEWNDEGGYAGRGTLDRVVVNELSYVYVRMYVDRGSVSSLAIMTDNDILRLKYIAKDMTNITLNSTIGNSLHIVIENVKKNMDDDAMMSETTTITINDGFDSSSRGTWTSTIEPNNETVELYCEVVDNSTDIITAKCDSETTWNESVFNRIPIWIFAGNALFGFNTFTNLVLFGAGSFSYDGSISSEWIQYDMSRSGTTGLIIGNQVTIKDLPTDFVNHWVDTIHAKAWMGDSYAIFVPPDSS